jgi:hypothetical protein
MFFHSTSGYFDRIESGSFLLASPITSIERTHARIKA